MNSGAKKFVVCLTIVSGAIGCAAPPPPQPEHIDRATWESPHAEFVRHNQPMLVAQGALPLIYQMQENGSVRIVDSTTNGEMAQATLRSMDIIRITTRGVVAGESQFAGPLAGDHRYAVYLLAPVEGQIQNAAPQTRPAQ